MTQIVVGTLQDPSTVLHEGRPESPVELSRWKYRSMWSWLRLQYGRDIDAEIRKALEEEAALNGFDAYWKLNKAQRMKVVREFFEEHAHPRIPRAIQFILDDNNTVMAVASLKHLLIPPSQVYGYTARIMQQEYPKATLKEYDGLSGVVYDLGSKAHAYDRGIQVHGGTITTRLAIRVAVMFEVRSCMNPLSWLNIGSFRSFLGDQADYERLLRIKAKAELEPRLREAIKAVVGKHKIIDKKIARTEKQSLDEKTAWLLSFAMGSSYSLGKSAILQVLEKFESEKQTQHGLSMAWSWVARHGEFKKGTEPNQRLSTISAAMIMMPNVKQAKQKSLDWLKKHIIAGKVKRLDDIIKEMS